MDRLVIIPSCGRYPGTVYKPAALTGFDCFCGQDGVSLRAVRTHSRVWATQLYRFFEVMAFFEAFCDESGIHSGSTVVMVGGVLAERAEWHSIMEGWDRNLHECGVNVFHASDLANSAKLYRGWGEAQRIKLLSGLMDVLSSHDLFFLAVGVETGQYRRIVAEYPSITFGAYDFCCNACLGEIVGHAGKTGKVPVSVTFEAGNKFGGTHTNRIMQHQLMYAQIREDTGLAAVTHANKAIVRPLEVADCLAYESYRYESDRAKGSNRPPRIPLLRMLEDRDHRCGLVSDHGIRLWLDHFQESIYSNVDPAP